MGNSNKQLVSINLFITNVNLVKDNGQTPFHLAKKLGMKGTIVCYKNGEYPFVKNISSWISLEYLVPSKFIIYSARFSVVKYIIKNYKKIDILMSYGFSKESMVYCFIYKTLRPEGKTYIKCDCNMGILERAILKNPIKRGLQKYLYNSVDLFSVESRQVKNTLLKIYPKIFSKKIEYLPNGISKDDLKFPVDIKNKEKTILFVGKVGDQVKAWDILIKAFKEIDSASWTLLLVGPLTLDYSSLENIVGNIPQNVKIVGNIESRNELYHYYSKSAIFCLPSLSESFGIAMVEAAVFGCYLVVSDLPSTQDITDGGRLGDLVIPGDLKSLKRALTKVMDPNFLHERETKSKELMSYARKNFIWEDLITRVSDRMGVNNS